MSEPNTTGRIVIDESVLDGLFRRQPPEPDPQPEVTQATEEPIEEANGAELDPSVPDQDSGGQVAGALKPAGSPTPVEELIDPAPGSEPAPVDPPSKHHPESVAPVDPSDPVWQHAQANESFAAADFRAAAEMYRKVLEVDPESWSAHLNLGMALEKLGEKTEALAEYWKAYEVDSSHVETCIRIGSLELGFERPGQALEAFDSALQMDSGNRQATFGRGAALQSLERFTEAMQCYDLLLSDDRVNGELLANLAATSIALNDLDRTIGFAKLLEDDVGDRELGLRLRVACAIAGGDAESAAHCLAQLVELTPDEFGSWFNLGVACQHTGRIDVAIDAYKQALEVMPGNLEAQGNLGAALHESEDLDAARQCYRSALQATPDGHPGVSWNLGLAAESLGAFEEAEKALSAVVRSQPGWKDAVSRLTRLNPSLSSGSV